MNDNIFNLDENTILYKVIEDSEGELIYCDENGNQLDKDNYIDKNNKDKRIKLCKIKSIKPIKYIDLLSQNEYYSIVNGSRLTQAQVEDNKIGMINPIEVYSSSEFDNHVMGYIEKDKLKEIKPNQPIFKGKSILLNTGGSVGKLRYKNNDYEYTSKDAVTLFYFNKSNKIIQPLFLKSILEIKLKNFIFGYENDLQGESINKINFKIPIYEDNIMLSIAKLLEDKINLIEKKKETLSSMKLLLKQKKENILENVFQKFDVKDKDNKDNDLKDIILYKMKENDDGELVYCDKDGNELDNYYDKRIELCRLRDVEFEEKKSPFLEKSKNKIIFTKEIKEINKLGIGRGEFVPKEEYVSNGKYPLYTSSKEKAGNYDKYNFGIENKYSITFPTDNIPTFNINHGYAWAGNVCAFIENYTLDIDTKYLYYYLHNEKRNHNNDYMNKFSLEYLQNNYKIFIPTMNKETKEEISSLELQKSIAFYIEQEFQKIEKQIKTIDNMILLLGAAKEKILNEVFKG